MRKHHHLLLASGFTMLGISLACITSAYAAKTIELKFPSAATLSSFKSSSTDLKRLTATTDVKHVTHVRFQEMYSGFPVLGGNIIIHTQSNKDTSLKGLITNKDATVSGILHQELNKDLITIPDSTQASKAIDHAIQLYGKNQHLAKTQEKADLMVYVDKNKKAHWVYQVSFEVQPEKGMRERPTYIMDAINFQVYYEWNDIMQFEEITGGGFGGNLRMGKLVFDGLSGNMSKLSMQRDSNSKTCYLANNDVTVKHYYDLKIIDFPCEITSSEHDNIYWNADFDTINGGYSPSNDALYAGKVIKEMYTNWYGVPPLVKDEKPMMINMVVHLKDDNAYWDGEKMNFGDGIFYFYPLTSLGVAGHEISHGFTQQHSHLIYAGQSGGLNEAFSDMAAQAAEFYSTGKNSWQIGPEIFKEDGKALRYMDDPTKDGRSIGHMKDYSDMLDVHFTSGIYNKIFYLIGTATGWDTKKAFDIMVHANIAYWRSNTDFHNAANCVLRSAADLGYDQYAVKNAFDAVGIYGTNLSNCY